jgi:quinoprotein glucose dehydrogenase
MRSGKVAVHIRGLLLSTALLAAAPARAQSRPPGDWPEARGDKASSRYSALAQIDRENVARLRVAWVYHSGDASAGKTTTIENTPVVVDGVMYLTSADRKLVALDATTGRELWRYDFAPMGRFASYPNYHGPNGLNRGVAYWSDARGEERRILLGTVDGRLLSVDARTGRLDPAFGDGGTVDLRAGEEHDLSTVFYGVTSPPGVYHDLVILGVSNGEGPPVEAPGDLRAFDVRTGRERWRFHTVPRPGEPGHEGWTGDSWKGRGGANAWSGVSIDEARGMVFAATGSVGDDFYGGDRPGANLYANSVLALDAATGKLLWHFQTVHHDVWDYDPAAPPNLVTVHREGRTVPAVAQLSKTGFLFLLDRLTGEPLIPVEERPVPGSTVPGERVWATQPHPVRPAPLARQRAVTREEVGGITPEHDAYCRALFDRVAVSGGTFTPYARELTLSFPGTMGGAEWSGAAFDPESGYLYVSVNEIGAMGRMVPVDSARADSPYRRVAPPSFRFWDPDRYPCQPPPWGTLNAVDLERGERVWSVPLGVFPALQARGVPPTGTPNLGGALATAGGLVFIASTMDARFRAFDARDGRVLWETELPAAGYAAPATYLGRDGRQYVVVAAGGGGKWGTPSGDAFVAFALPR